MKNLDRMMKERQKGVNYGAEIVRNKAWRNRLESGETIARMERLET